MRFVRLGLVLAASFVTPSIVAAQPAAAVAAARLTLDAAIAEALEQNLTLIATRAGVTIADANTITAQLRPNPVLSLGGDHLDVLGTGFDDANGARLRTGNRRACCTRQAAKLLLAIFDQRDEWHGEPLHEAVVRMLEAHGIAGVTVLQGLTGYGAHHAVHRKGLIDRPHDKPIAVVVIDGDATLRAILPTIRPMIAQGVVVLTDAEVIPLL